MSFVVTGDTHLHPGAWSSLPEVNGDAYRSFEQIVHHCITHKVSGLFLAGDVFDAQPPASTVAFFLKQMLALEAAGIPVWAIQGQHGRDRHLPWTSVYPYVKHLHNQVVILEGISISGFDNLPPEELKTTLVGLPSSIKLLILHQMARGAVPDIAGRQTWDFDPEWCPPFVKLVLMGDYHNGWQHDQELDGFRTHFEYTGSTCMQSINEPPEKSFIEVEVIQGEMKLNRVPLQTRPFFKLTVLDASALEDLLSRFPQVPAGALCHVEFDPRVPDVEAKLRTTNPAVHLKLDQLSFSDTADHPPLPEALERSLLGCLDSLVKRDEEPALHSFMSGLLRSKSKADYIQGERAKRFPEALPQELPK